jgi:hypothetical protein
MGKYPIFKAPSDVAALAAVVSDDDEPPPQAARNVDQPAMARPVTPASRRKSRRLGDVKFG